MTDTIPQCWQATVKPFLQRAHDFQSRDPVVSYFLRRHVVFMCMRNRPKGDAEAKVFLSDLLDQLEAEGKELGHKSHDSEGKAVLVYTGLKLFAKADEQEKAGVVALPVVQLFFTAALLLEATSQFTEDNSIPTGFADKCKYAKYVATRMKRAIDCHESYVNPTTQTTLDAEQPGVATDMADHSHAQPLAATMPNPPPPHSIIPSAAHGGDGINMDELANELHVLPPPPPPRPLQPMPHPVSTSAPPAVYIPPVYPTTITESSGGATSTVLVEQMIDAQKYARQAVSALQFYDAPNAVMQLEKALATLRGAS